VVKALHTVNGRLMVEPSLVPGSHTIFVCGNDSAAKCQVAELLRSFGWPAEDVMDLGDITGALGWRLYVGFWLRIWAVTGSTRFNVKLITAQDRETSADGGLDRSRHP
jgi:8-hydroxy-5-deazaflavin:NADPH oxidoreductase